MAARKQSLRKGVRSGLSAETQRQFRAAAQRLRAAGALLDMEFEHGLFLIGEEIMADVKDSRPGKGVPVDTGALRSTGQVIRDGAGRKRISGRAHVGKLAGKHAPVQLTFGGAGTPYALIQHENMRFKHKVGEARYLVRGMERWSPSRSGAWAELVSRSRARLATMRVKGGMR